MHIKLKKVSLRKSTQEQYKKYILYPGLTKSKHSIGHITGEHDDEIRIRSRVKNGKTLYWPHPIQEFSERERKIMFIVNNLLDRSKFREN